MSNDQPVSATDLPRDLVGKRSIVVGGGQGIGEAIARQLTARGARVAVVDLRTERAERVAADLPGALPITCDATVTDQVNATVDQVVAEFGGVDHLVMSVSPDGDVVKQAALKTLAAKAQDGPGLVPAERTFDTTRFMTDEQWDAELRTVLFSCFAFTRAVLNVMVPQESGAIVHLSSVHGISGYPGFPHYSAAKAGIVGFTRSVAREVGPHGIRANAITAGYVTTPLSDQLMSPHFKAATSDLTALGRLGTTDEIANLACFLLSDQGSFITGQAISANGGYLTVPS